MSTFAFINPGPIRRAGRPRCAITHLLALHYLLWKGKRPRGLLKQLAASNNIEERVLTEVVYDIRKRVREDKGE